MATQLYSNNARSTLASAINNVTTTIPLAVGEGSKFPSPTGSQFFLATVEVGSSSEIFKVTSRTIDSLTVVRGQEGTVGANWPQGALVEMRITRDTLNRFARAQDVLPEIATLDLVVSPVTDGFTSYIIHDVDDEGIPIVIVRDTSTKWKFLNHHKIVGTTVTSATTTSVTAAAISGKVPSVVAGKYVIQFTSGSYTGQSRLITSAGGTTVNWTTPLAGAPVGGDSFEIYQSTYSLINSAFAAANDGLAFALVFGE